MILGLPPILGLLPLIIYIILAFKEVHPVVNVFVCVLLGAIMTNQPLLGLGGVIAEALGSFLSLIGLIIMLGSGLGAVLRRTGVAENIVNVVMHRIGVNTEAKAVVAAMATSVILVSLLGTLAGANAILAPIVIPLVAAIGITPSTLAAIFQGAGQSGLFLGPFTPPMVTLMELTGLSYPQVLLTAGLPVSVICWVITYFMALRIQRATRDVYTYGADVVRVSDTYVATPEVKRATATFLLTLAALLVYGMIVKGGASYAVVVMFTAAVTTGLAGGLKMGEIFDAMMEGCGRLVWLFIMFVLFEPFLAFVEKSGAFAALVELLKPIIESSGKTVFALFTTLVGVFGISGAAVAQAVLLNKMFSAFLSELSIPMGLWAAILLIGSQMTSFAYPGADMLGQMGLARSKDLKSMIKLGLSLVAGTVLYVLVYSLF
ncbi:MAG TPA: citrate transporter [Firmicutes bacterium]|jgi:predicted histidine transporter YuiF (NhaC family)|nr:citrate transporter [Bacillota bacterium]